MVDSNGNNHNGSTNSSYNVNIGGQNGLNLLINYSNNNNIVSPSQKKQKGKKKNYMSQTKNQTQSFAFNSRFKGERENKKSRDPVVRGIVSTKEQEAFSVTESELANVINARAIAPRNVSKD